MLPGLHLHCFTCYQECEPLSFRNFSTACCMKTRRRLEPGKKLKIMRNTERASVSGCYKPDTLIRDPSLFVLGVRDTQGWLTGIGCPAYVHTLVPGSVSLSPRV